MKVKTVTDAAVVRRETLGDRHALNVRSAAESLNDALMRETDSLISTDLDAARATFAASMEITHALIRDDIVALGRILDARA